MAFAGEDQQRAGDAQVVQGVVKQIVFGDRNADIIASADQMGGSLDFVHLEDGGFVVIALRRFPGNASEKIGVVEGHVVIAPVGDVLDGSGSGDSNFEARGLSDQPVGHVAAVAVAAHGQVGCHRRCRL